MPYFRFDVKTPGAAKSNQVNTTQIAQKALSAVVRLEERHEMEYVVDFLRGSKSEMILERHRQLKTFAVGADLTRQEWLNHLRDLVSLGYLKRLDSSVLAVTEKGWRVLQGEEDVWMEKSSLGNKIAFVKKPRGKAPEFEPDLLEELKKVRKYLAAKYEVEGEDVIPHLRLHQLSVYLPSTPHDMQTLTGLDDERMKRYGTGFLKVIRQYLEINAMPSRMDRWKGG